MKEQWQLRWTWNHTDAFVGDMRGKPGSCPYESEEEARRDFAIYKEEGHVLNLELWHMKPERVL